MFHSKFARTGFKMKKYLLGSLALAAALSGQALAADLPVKTPPKPYHYWNFCYLGGNVGWARERVDDYWIVVNPAAAGGFGAAQSSLINATSVTTLRKNGVIGGGQIGCNFQVNQFVAWGVEGDFQGANLNVTRISTFNGGVGLTGTEEQTFKVAWVSTVRARVGVTFFSNWLLYGTAGFAFANITYRDCETRVVATACDTSGASGAFNLVNFNQTRIGYAAGGGLEIPWDKWSFKAEYLYVGIPAVTTLSNQQSPFVASTFDIQHFHKHEDIQMARIGVNYHFWCCGPAAPALVKAAY
jgi:outer membrane immunogenic protein